MSTSRLLNAARHSSKRLPGSRAGATSPASTTLAAAAASAGAGGGPPACWSSWFLSFLPQAGAASNASASASRFMATEPSTLYTRAVESVEYLVIGAGVSGLSFANWVGGEVLVVEAEAEPGGWCRTERRAGFVW